MLGIGVSPVVGVLLLGAAVSGGLSVYTWRRTATLARWPFVWLTATVAAWETLYAVALSTPSGPTRATLEAVYMVSAGVVAVWWALFGLSYGGRPDLVTRQTLGLASLPVVAAATAVAVDPSGMLMWSPEQGRLAGVTVVRRTDLSLGYLAYVGYLYTLIAVGFVFLFRRVRGGPSAYDRQTIWLAAGATPAAIGGIVDVAVPTALPGLRTVPLVVPLTMTAFAVALFRHDLTEIVPGTGRVGREAALRDLADPVVVTDGDGRVADMNAAAADTFGVASADAVGAPLSTVVGGQHAAESIADGATVPLGTARGRRRFEVSASQVGGGDDRSVGRALVLRDVTRRRLREQRLEVLNRVVRHNLRNDMNTVSGYAEVLSPHVEEGTADAPVDGEEYLDRIQQVSTDLVDLGEKVRAFERTLTEDTGRGRVWVAPLLEHVVTDLSASHRGDVTVDAPDDLSLVTDGAVLEMVGENAVENALEHAGDAPTVAITARRDGDSVAISVADDGPGVPAEERRALASGEESPLQHGSGLGLWIVAWGTQWLGGEVTFDCEDGTTLTVRVPDGDGTSRVTSDAVDTGVDSSDNGGDPTPTSNPGAARDRAGTVDGADARPENPRGPSRTTRPDDGDETGSRPAGGEETGSQPVERDETGSRPDERDGTGAGEVGDPPWPADND